MVTFPTKDSSIPSIEEIKTKIVEEGVVSTKPTYGSRLVFLTWKVDVELLEVVSGAGTWLLLSDMLTNKIAGYHNSVYDGMFGVLTHTPFHIRDCSWGWITLLGALAFWHLVAILNNYIRTRSNLMFTCFLVLLAMVVLIAGTLPHSLGWKFIILMCVCSGWSHVRVRKQIARNKKKD